MKSHIPIFKKPDFGKLNLISIILMVIVFGLTVSSCNYRKSEGGLEDSEAIANNIEIPSIRDTVFISGNNYMMLSVLFHQKAAEAAALYFQAFSAARMALLEDLKDESVETKRVIVTDIDETMLDNSPYQAMLIKEDKKYPYGWDEWCGLAGAEPLPGALEFLEFVRAYGVDVIYITNRKEHLRDATKRNLIAYGFPQVEDDHLLMRTDDNSKESRRRKILENHHISLYCGDNLNDFSEVFKLHDPVSRRHITDSLSSMFGKRFIVMPNAMYGDWESAIYNFNYKLPEDQKILSRYNELEDY